MRTSTPILLCASLTALGLTLGSTGHAASAVFTGKANVNWNNTTNWLAGAIPAPGDDLVIADLTTNHLTLNDGPHTIGVLQFGATGTRANPGSPQFIINGNVTAAGAYPLTITNGVIANGNFNSSGTAGFQTKVPITVEGDQVWSVGGALGTSIADFGLMLTVGANGVQRPVVLNGKLTKVGPGQLCFVGQNVGNGDIIVNQGSLKFNAGSSSILTVGGTGSVTVNSGGSLFISRNSGTLNITKAIVLNSGSTLRLGGNNAGANTVGSPFTFNGTVPIILEYASLLLDFTNNWNGTINSVITGSGGVATLWGDNSALAGVLNNNGTFRLRLGSANAGSPAAEWALNNANAYYEVYGPVTEIALGALSGPAGTVRNSNTNNAAATVTVGALNTSTTFGGVLADNTASLNLVKVGTGTLTLSGANSYSGTTVVSNGTLLIQGATATSGSGNMTVYSGGSLGGNGSVVAPLVVAAGGILRADGGIGASVLTVANSLTFGNGPADQTTTRVNVYRGGQIAAASLVVNGLNTIDIISSAPGVGVYDLITYSGSIGGAGFAGFKMGALPYGVVAHLQNSGTAVQLNVTAITAEPGVWTGAVAGAWNLGGGLEWKGATSGNPQSYHDLDVVTFDDSATNFAVNITENVSPTFVTVNNSAHDYTLSGAGAMGGDAALGKTGSGTLVIANPNTYSGGTYITNGVIQIGDGGTSGSIAGPIVDDGRLFLNRADAFTVSGGISGSGVVEQRGSGIATLTGVNSFTGQATVASGTLVAGSASALGDTNASTVVAAGATLDVNANVGMEPIMAQGGGVGGAGAIVNNGAGDQQNALRYVTLTGPTTFGGARRWDVRDPSSSALTAGLNAQLQANGFKVTKVSSNVVAFINVGETGLGDVDIQAGTLTFSRSTFLGNAAKAITVFPGATLQLHRTSEYLNNELNKVLLMTNATFAIESNGLTNLFIGPITLSGSNFVSLPAATGLNLQGTMSGDGTLNASGGGTLILSGNAAHTGGTAISGGVIEVDGTLAAAAAPVSLANTILSGNGTIKAAVTIPSGSTLAPGVGDAGALTINNTLTLAAGSISRFEINKDVGTNDLVQGLTSVTYGGTLTLTNTGSTAYAPGDSFKLFAASAYNGAFASVVPAIPAVGLLWDTNSLRINGTLKVVVLPTPRPLVVLSAASLINPEINVVFDNILDPITAQDISNYTLNTTNQIVGASVVNDTNVVLTLDYPLTKSTFTVQVKNVRDISFVPNVVVTTNVPGVAVGFEQKVYSVITNGSAFAFADKIKVYADGSDIFNTSDQFEFVYKQVTNDFDFSVKLESFLATDPAAKAGIMAREITDAIYLYPAERMAMATSFPPDPGRQQNLFQWRELADTAAAAMASPRPPATFPNNWVRLKRVGPVFSAYCSSNNMEWVFMGALDTSTNSTGAFNEVLRVGLAATSHNVAQTTEVVFSKFGAPGTSVSLTVTAVGPDVQLNWPVDGLGAALQTTSSLTPPVQWTTVPGSTLTNWVQVPIGPGSIFFRLAKD
jgi:autotransporter-associated beta strand protein